MTSELPRVSIVVPVWNGEATIGACLAAIEAQRYPRERIQLIVVDNGSTDSTLAILERHPGLTLLHEPEPGSYNARNRGLQVADGEFLAFTDADCQPEPDWLANAVAAALADPGAGVVGGRIELFSTEGHSELSRLYENLLSFDQQNYIRHGHCATANWLSPRALIESLGGFDGRLKSGGDFELSQRVRASGRTIVYCAGMVVRHPCRGSFGALLGKRRRTTGGQWPLQQTLRQRTKYVLGIGVQVLRESRRILAHRALPIGARLQLCGLSAALAGGQYLELFGLMLGAAPRRA
jgi:glycosyltransferase involved in cell wall biosynthesis